MNRYPAPYKRLSRFLLAVLALTAWMSLTPATAAVCGLTITQNTTLTEDLLGCEGDGVIVAADGVTLDLNGHSIVGLRKERTVGVRAEGVKNLTITNGSIAAFERGIYLYDVTDAMIDKVEVNASRYEGLMAYKSSAVRVLDSVFSYNTRAAVWIFDTDAELVGNLALDNPNRSFYLSGGRVGMSGNVARGGAYYSAFSFANGYIASDYSLQDNLADGVVGIGYLFAWGFAGSVTDEQGNSATNTGGVECWTEEGIACPIDLSSAPTEHFCGNNICDAEESVCSCASDCGLPPVENCADGIDNNCDGDIDCADASCALDEICYIPPVPVPAECKLPGEVCADDVDCCTSDCRISARGRMGGTCR